jgi:hypothetical protein
MILLLEQYKFVSNTMKTEQEANLAQISEEKSKAYAATPLEPLIVNLIKGYINDADLSTKRQELYKIYYIT